MSLYSDRLQEAVNMTAEQFVIDLLSNGQRLTPEAATRLLAEVKDVHAHELAQSQRAWVADRTDLPWWVDQIPDLIDPEVKP